MSARLEVDLERIGHNARALVALARVRGVSITGVTKAMLGLPELAHSMLDAGVVGLADARIENIERMREGGIRAPITLLRSPVPSEIDRVITAADVSCNSEIATVERLSSAAVDAHRRHGVVLMVELGDLREGLLPGDLLGAFGHCHQLPGVEVVGIGANLACRSGIAPDDTNMTTLSDLADALTRRFGVHLRVVTGGNSANLTWLQSTNSVGRINDLRLGESILLGCEPLRGLAIAGLHQDTAALVATVVESKRKPLQPWGERARVPFAPIGSERSTSELGCGWQAILAVGHLDTDPAHLTPPVGVRIVGASSDHLVVVSRCQIQLGHEVRFRPGYAAFARAMASPYVEKLVTYAPSLACTGANSPAEPLQNR